jgi:hypothetical protein
MITQPINRVAINVARPYVSVTSNRAGSLARPPGASRSSKRSICECSTKTTPVVAQSRRDEGVNPLLVITAAQSAE